MINVNYLVN